MIMMVVTAMAVELLVAAVLTVKTAPMILPLMAVNAVIQPGMNMASIVQHWKVTTAGIAQAVTAQVIMVEQTAEPMVVIVALVI